VWFATLQPKWIANLEIKPDLKNLSKTFFFVPITNKIPINSYLYLSGKEIWQGEQ